MKLRPACLLFLLAGAATSSRADCGAQLVFGPVKIRPYGPLTAPLAAPLVCARNQICSFQVVVTAAGEDCRVTDVSLTGFAAPGARLSSPQSAIFRQDFLNVFYRSNEQGDLGEWPDALIPKTDPDFGESRNAFPAAVSRISLAYHRYRIRGGRTLPPASSSGRAVSGGRYTGAKEKSYVVEIVQGGALGAAAFRWWTEPGPGVRSPAKLTSRAALPLAEGVTLAFDGSGQPGDFILGDQFHIHAGPARRQPFWVDVSIPRDAQPRRYAAEAVVSFAGRTAVRLPIELRVMDFELPASSSLPNHFGMNWRSIARAHFANAPGGPEPSPEATLQMGGLYARAALRNRVTVEGGKEFEPLYTFGADGALLFADTAAYDRAVGAFLDGKETPGGAQWTSLRLPSFSRLPPQQQKQAIRHFTEHARRRGWLNRLFDLLFDEPGRPEHFAQLRRRAELLRDSGPQVARLASTDLNPSLLGLVQRWAPVVNHIEPRAETPRQWWRSRRFPRRADYDARLRAGDTLWWYHSCLSHGCAETGRSPGNDNWPSMMVDASAVANRVFGFLTAVTYEMGGMLYWDVGFALAQASEMPSPGVDAWLSLYYFGGNGDGTLFYPGRPAQVGGTRHIPIESLRLKFVRDSLYDADYARLLRRSGEADFLRREVSRVVEKAWRWDPDPQAWLELRRRLAERIEQAHRRATP